MCRADQGGASGRRGSEHPAVLAAAAAEPLAKVIASAAANAENNFDMDPDTLVVAVAYVDEGPTLKRIRPRAQGRAYRIRKRTSHITIEVESRAVVKAGGRGGRGAKGRAR